MKKKIITFCIMCLSLLITGCTIKQSYTYELETGEKVEISIDTTDNINITPQIPFSVMKDMKTTLSRGTFIDAEFYDTVVEAAKENGEVVAEGKNDNYSYIMIFYNEESYDCVIKIDDSNVAIILSNSNSKEEALDILNRLTFKIEK